MNDAELSAAYRALTDDQRHELHERLMGVKINLFSANSDPESALLRAYFEGRDSVTNPRRYKSVMDWIPR